MADTLRENIVSLLPDKIKEINITNNYDITIDNVYFSNTPKKSDSENIIRVYIDNEKRKSFLENEESVKQSDLILVLIYKGYANNIDNIEKEAENIIKDVIEYFENDNDEYLKHFDKTILQNDNNVIEDLYIPTIENFIEDNIINIYFEIAIEYYTYN